MQIEEGEQERLRLEKQLSEGETTIHSLATPRPAHLSPHTSLVSLILEPRLSYRLSWSHTQVALSFHVSVSGNVSGTTLAAQEGVSDFQEQGEASPSEATLSHAMSHMAIAKARRAGPVATKAIRMPAKATALWNAAKESAESKAIKLHTKPVFGVPIKGAYRGYQASKQRSYLPKDYHARGAYAEARQQALWNAATDGGSSAVFHPKPKPSYGVPLKGAYRGYDANSQVSYLPKDYQAPGASYSAARTTELWDAAANDASLESTRQKLGIASSASSGTHSPENGDAPRDYIADFH